MLRFILAIQRKRRMKQFTQRRNEEKQQHQQRPRHSSRPSGKKKLVLILGIVWRWIRGDGWAAIGTTALLIFVIWYMGFSQDRFIVHISLSEKTQFIAEEDILRFGQEYLEKEILWVIPRNRYWTLREAGLQQYMQEKLQSSYATQSVSVEKIFPNTVHILVQERIPSVVWVTGQEEQKQYVFVDREGIVTHVVQNQSEIHPAFPVIEDPNRDRLEVGWNIVSKEYIDFLLLFHEQFSQKTGIELSSYRFPLTQCQERQYVTEQIFEQEILDSASEEFREKKRQIQESFQEGLLTIDQSLDELENIKNEELLRLGEEKHEDGFGKLAWQAVFVDVPCDFVKIATDLHVTTKAKDDGSMNSFVFYFDTTKDMTIQIENALTVLEKNIHDKTRIEYIDVRILDRAYFKEL